MGQEGEGEERKDGATSIMSTHENVLRDDLTVLQPNYDLNHQKSQRALFANKMATFLDPLAFIDGAGLGQFGDSS